MQELRANVRPDARSPGQIHRKNHSVRFQSELHRRKCRRLLGVADRYGRRPAILVGLLISAVAYVIFAFAGSIWLLFLSRVIQGLGGGTIGVVQAYVADISIEKDRAKALGWLSAVTSLGAVIGPALGSLPR